MRQIRRLPWLEISLVLSMIALAVQLLPDAAQLWQEWPRAGRQTPARATLRLDGGNNTEVQYYVYLPQDYSSSRRWPLLLYLHGSGERGNDLAKVLHNGPAGIIAEGHHWPLIVITPQCREGESWNSRQLLALLDHVEQRFAVDTDRIYVGGYSMGGYGAWALACEAPERFAAIIPVAGGGEVNDAERLTPLAIWAFHGSADDVVPPDQTQKMIEAIQAMGGNSQLTTYAGIGHAIDRVTFAREDLLDWLLRQRRSQRDTSP